MERNKIFVHLQYVIEEAFNKGEEIGRERLTDEKKVLVYLNELKQNICNQFIDTFAQTDLIIDLKAQLKHSYIEFKVLEDATVIDDLCRRNEMYGSMNVTEYVLKRLGVSQEELTELTNFKPKS